MQLATYLNDHLSGSTAALEMLEYLENAHPALAPFLRRSGTTARKTARNWKP
jgi:hypothetical protein